MGFYFQPLEVSIYDVCNICPIGHSFGYIFRGICPNITDLLASGRAAARPGRLTSYLRDCEEKDKTPYNRYV